MTLAHSWLFHLSSRTAGCVGLWALLITGNVALAVTAAAQVNIITTVAGNGDICCTQGNGFAATSANVPTPMDVVFDTSHNLYITSGQMVRQVAPTGIIGTFLSVPGQGIGTPAPLSAMAIDQQDNLYLAEAGVYCRVIRIDKSGMVTTVAGLDSLFATGTPDGENVPGRSVRLNFHLFGHNGLAVDAEGDLFITDGENQRVRRLTPSGIISTYAGRMGVSGFSGDGDAALKASLNAPSGLAVDNAGNLYIADTQNQRIRRVSRTGTIVTVAGSGGPEGGFAGDGGQATNARLNHPQGVAVDVNGNIYIADTGNARIRKVDTNGMISTVAGSGVAFGCSGFIPCYGGDNGPAISAQLSPSLTNVTVDNTTGDLYIADTGNNRVRKVLLNASPTQVPPPTISSAVLNGASFEQAIASGTWATIFGDNLAPVPLAGRIWRSDEIVNGNLPTSLDGVTVRIDGKPAYLYFISPKQLNLLIPDGISSGRVTAEVRTPSGSATTTATVQTIVPAFFRTGPATFSGTFYAAAIHQDGTLVGPSTLAPRATPARPREFISVFGTGFGMTSPVRPSGQIIEPSPLQAAVSLQLDLTPIKPSFAGIVTPGLYQFNFQVPDISYTLNEPLLYVQIGGQTSRLDTVIAIQK